MKQLTVVFLRTYLKQVKSWSFFFMILSPFLILGGTALFGMIGQSLAKENNQLALVDNNVTSHLLAQSDLYKVYEKESAAQKAIEKKEVVGYLEIKEESGKIQATYHSNQGLTLTDRQQLETQLQGLQMQKNLESAQVSEAQARTLLQPFEIKEELNQRNAYDKLILQGSLFALIMVMYVLFMIYSSVVAQDLASEKGAKVMEVILSSISASYYFLARMAGLMAVILTHIASYVLMFYLSYQLLLVHGQFKTYKPMVDQALQKFSWVNLLYVVLGLFLYVVLAAVCGSLVRRQEDVNKAIQPIMFFIIFVMALAISVIPNSETGLAKVASFIPLTSPFIMPVRLINGQVPGWQNVISLLLLFAIIWGLLEFIPKRYATLILQGENVSLWQVIKRTVQHQ